MSNTKPSFPPTNEEEEAPRPGPNLALYYGLIVIAMLVAIAIAAFIVIPFHHRH